jgi:hypothetical protein
MLMPSPNKPVQAYHLVIFQLLVRFLELWHNSVSFTVLDYLIVCISHYFLNFLVKKLPIDSRLLDAHQVFLNGVNFLVALALILLLCDS